jgi:predicted  nucleic acid-binding Zn-ribbon protein
MKNPVEILYAAQIALKHHPLPSPERQAVLENLRAQVPAPLLAHFLRLVERGKPGVTVVRHGVCTGCHLRVASGIAAALANPKDVHLCDSCGSYLILAPEEMVTVHESHRSNAHNVAA